MKSKLLILAAVLAAVALGFWAGSRHRHSVDTRFYEGFYYDQKHLIGSLSAQRITSVLKDLAEGRQHEARETLEQRLDIELIAMVAYWKTFHPNERGSLDVDIVRKARAYRTQHPWTWTNRPPGDVQVAFKWAE